MRVRNLNLSHLLSLFLASSAFADRGAFTVDAGGAVTGLLLTAPYATNRTTTPGVAPALTLGARYALSNHIEVTLRAYYEFPVTYAYARTVTEVSGSLYPGTLSHTFTRFGGAGGFRWVHGFRFRSIVGAELGWSHRIYSGLVATTGATTGAAEPLDYGLSIPAFTRDNPSFAIAVGFEWCLADQWSVSFVPKAEVLAGRDAAFGVTFPLTLSWSNYL